MNREEMKGTLEKQLQLLHERSKERIFDYTGLAEITKAMCTITETITRIFQYDQ